ncbi:MAG: hypothetical protein U0892_03560 [Pirellulales bacterium]
MNYLAHGYRFTDDPYFVAGTALPDWMSVIDRKNRARSQRAETQIEDADPRIRALARGVMQHHDDDRRFHQLQEFAELSTRFAVELRSLLSEGHQAGFLGHIAVELLLDAVLIEEAPHRLESYYNALLQLDASVLQSAANRILARETQSLILLLPRFIAERFLADYTDDARLWRRLNHVMRRVQLAPLPESVIEWLPGARTRVRAAAPQLLMLDKVP